MTGAGETIARVAAEATVLMGLALALVRWAAARGAGASAGRTATVLGALTAAHNAIKAGLPAKDDWERATQVVPLPEAMQQ